MTNPPLSPATASGGPGAARVAGGRWGPLIFPGIVLITVVAGLLAQQWTTPVGVWVFILVLGGWMITLCLHEFAHALVAYWGGDTSVRARGYLTLNPIRYSNAAMTFVVPLVILAVGGFPLPGGAVLIEHHRIRSAITRSLVSLAGPLVNALAGITLAVLSRGLHSPLGDGLAFLGLLQVVVAILNLLPFPGLDGWGVIAPFLPAKLLAKVRPYAQWAPMILIVLLISFPQLSRPLWEASYYVFELFGGSSVSAGRGNVLFHFWR